jgi:amino acid transporter
MVEKFKEIVFGKPRDIKDPQVFRNVSLIAFLAWVGLGADGLSSSAYGPDEAFRALGPHTHLSPFLVLMTAITIFVISIAYSNLIQHFPGGGGGYLVASKLLGNKVGVVSGCALLVDYVLTISVSIASGCDALWSFLPPHWVPYKLTAEFVALGFLMMLNLRGVKESVTFLAPIFMVFIVTHVFAILYAIGSRFTQLPEVFHGASTDFHSAISVLGFWPVIFILLRAYSMGGGTYTGIEAVSNGVTMLREPRVKTGKKTMFLMATSLAFTAGGILFGYMLTHAMPAEGKTMNAVLFENLFSTWKWGSWSFGSSLVILSLVAEAALLFVAAQTGFLDGPRVLANMALDSWMPPRFSQLSNRLVTNNGVYLMGGAAILTLMYTRGNITMLVVMYSINVFLTFTLTELGMARHWIKDRAKEPRWKSQLSIHGTGLVMCLCILFVTLYEKFAEGGWMTVLITSITIALCFLIRTHYRHVAEGFKDLDKILEASPLPATPIADPVPMDKNAPTAILTVQHFSGFGLHQILSIQRLMPGYIKNFIFISVGVVDSGNFKGSEELASLEERTRSNLERYVQWCRNQGLKAEYRMSIATEAVESLEMLCVQVAKEFPKSIVFTGKLIFREEHWYQRLLHNETATALQSRLQFDGLQTIVLPIRVLAAGTAA